MEKRAVKSLKHIGFWKYEPDSCNYRRTVAQVEYEEKHDKDRVLCNIGVGDLVWLKPSKKRLTGEGKSLQPLKYMHFQMLEKIWTMLPTLLGNVFGH